MKRLDEILARCEAATPGTDLVDRICDHLSVLRNRGTEKDTRAIIELTLNCLKERSQRRRHGEDEMKLEELEFKAEDFIDEENRTAVEELGAVFGFNPITALERLAGMSAARANRILREKLENAPSVFGNKSARGLWCFDEQPLEVDTHKARVVCIEEIKK